MPKLEDDEDTNSEAEEDNKTLSISSDDIPTSSSTNASTSQATTPIESWIFLEVADVNQD